MINTINISIPSQLYKEIKNFLTKRGYASISEFFRDAARDKLHPMVTENGFTPEFERRVLEAAKEPLRDDDVVLKTDKDVENYFRHLRRPRKGRSYDSVHSQRRI